VPRETKIQSKWQTECTICKGTGFEFTNAPTGITEVFGNEYIPNDFVKPCSRCKGLSAYDSDPSGIPLEFSSVDIANFDFEIYSKEVKNLKNITYAFFDHYGDMVNEIEGLYLWSENPGSGKTRLACSIGKSIMIRYGIQMRFITVPDYLEKVRMSYDKDKGECDPTQIYKECSLLILDDIGTQVNKEWQNQELFRLINARHSKQLLTICTSNYPVEKLNVDERTKSRLMADCLPLRMPEESIRKKITDNKHERIINRYLTRSI